MTKNAVLTIKECGREFSAREMEVIRNIEPAHKLKISFSARSKTHILVHENTKLTSRRRPKSLSGYDIGLVFSQDLIFGRTSPVGLSFFGRMF